MKALSLFALGTFFLLSAALPEGKGKGHDSGLLQTDDGKNGEALQRRKPPVKIPGPALAEDDDDDDRQKDHQKSLTNEEYGKSVSLTNDKNKKHLYGLEGKKNGRHFAVGDDEEETQEERNRIPMQDRN